MTNKRKFPAFSSTCKMTSVQRHRQRLPTIKLMSIDAEAVQSILYKTTFTTNEFDQSTWLYHTFQK